MPPCSRELLTARVTIANPFDIHTYLWFDPPALGRVFSTVLHAGFDAVGFMLDCPPDGKSDTAAFDAVIDVFIDAARGAPTRAALVASLPETLGARIREHCLAGGVVPLQGQREALEALALAGAVGRSLGAGPAPAAAAARGGGAAGAGAHSYARRSGGQSRLGGVWPARRAGHQRSGVRRGGGRGRSVGFPVVIKAIGAHLEHKTEVGGVVLNVRSPAEADAAVARLAGLSNTLLVEPMITDGVAEILVGVILDPQFGLVLVVGAGGVLTELLADSISLLPPWTKESIEAALRKLKAAPLLGGFRGKPAGDVAALVEAVHAVARYAERTSRVALGTRCQSDHRPARSATALSPSTPSFVSRSNEAMSQGIHHRQRRRDPRGEDRPAEGQCDRPGREPAPQRGLQRLFATIAALRIAIITGTGEKFFCPGWDLKAAAAGEKSDEDWGAGGFGGLNYPRNLNKPIIAAVNGIACGGGFEIVLGTDIIVMEEHAKFALPEINVGVLADAGTIKLPRRVPYHVAVEFLLTGRWMDAGEAKHWGLANHVVPKGQALTKAREIARQLADGPPLLFPAIKQLIRQAEMVPEHQAFELHDALDAVQRVDPLRRPQGRHARLHREAQAQVERSLNANAALRHQAATAAARRASSRPWPFAELSRRHSSTAEDRATRLSKKKNHSMTE